MRRLLLVLLAGVGLLVGGLGCHHTAGVCDCAGIEGPSCCTYGALHSAGTYGGVPAH